MKFMIMTSSTPDKYRAFINIPGSSLHLKVLLFLNSKSLSSLSLKMSNGGGFIVIDGSKIRAIDLSLSDHQASTLTGAQVIEQAESKFGTSLWGVKMLDSFELSALDRMGYADHTSFLDAKFDQEQGSVKLKEFFDAAADLLDDDPLVVSILNGSTMQLYLEDEDDFAMLAENLFTDLDVEDKGKIRKSEVVRALEHMGVDMGVPPPSEFPALNEILRKHGAEGGEELGQAQFAQVLQPVLQELADALAKNQLIITHSTKVANGCRIKKLLTSEKLFSDVTDKMWRVDVEVSDRQGAIKSVRTYLEDNGVELGLPPLDVEELRNLYEEVFLEVADENQKKTAEMGKDEFAVLVKGTLEKFVEQLESNPFFYELGN